MIRGCSRRRWWELPLPAMLPSCSAASPSTPSPCHTCKVPIRSLDFLKIVLLNVYVMDNFVLSYWKWVTVNSIKFQYSSHCILHSVKFSAKFHSMVIAINILKSDSLKHLNVFLIIIYVFKVSYFAAICVNYWRFN